MAEYFRPIFGCTARVGLIREAGKLLGLGDDEDWQGAAQAALLDDGNNRRRTALWPLLGKSCWRSWINQVLPRKGCCIRHFGNGTDVSSLLQNFQHCDVFVLLQP